MFTVCLRYVYGMFTVSLRYVYVKFTVCLRYVYGIFTTCLRINFQVNIVRVCCVSITTIKNTLSSTTGNGINSGQGTWIVTWLVDF